MNATKTIISLFESLTGQTAPLSKYKDLFSHNELFSKGGIGYSQFNEILLTLGYDRVTKDFFNYLFSIGPYSSESSHHPQVSTFGEFQAGVEKFQKHSLLLYGNVKYGFKTFARLDKNALAQELSRIFPIAKEHYEQRHTPLQNLIEIPPEDTYYLGYIVYNQVKRDLEKDPTNTALKKQHQTILDTRTKGGKNHDIYLTYDHMDVYVATSMRQRHEYFLVNGFCKNLFSRPSIAPLKLRYFDPTQAYCSDRLDKGLVEGLMLKRAKCTIYHAQETDTLGKDSELATTLAQGKTVIAYVPKLKGKDQFLKDALALTTHLYPGLSRQEHFESLLRLYDPEGVWQNPDIRNWLSKTVPFDEAKASEILFTKAQARYESRANTLIHDHPLGLQINLSTGVANGVLVTRTVNQCAELLRRVMLNEMEFSLEEILVEDRTTLVLREKISGCVYRAMTGDELLNNSFWNFYLKETLPHGKMQPRYLTEAQLILELENQD